MTNNLKTLIFTKILIAISISNFAALVILNFLEMPPTAVVFVYPVALLSTFHFLDKTPIPSLQNAPDKICIFLALSTIILLTAPRLFYLLEWLPDNAVFACFDDYARLAELISMTLSDKYPIKHPANTGYLLSFYYTSLYPMAFIKLTIPALTLKDAIAIGSLLYHILFIMSLVEVAHLIFNEKTSTQILVFLCTIFGGFEWLLRQPHAGGHWEWWQHTLFNGNTQISSFYTAMFWTPHHFIGFYALILSFILITRSQTNRPQLKESLTISLLASAFYSSPFSSMSYPFIAAAHTKIIRDQIIRSKALPFIIIASLVPLFFFVGKLPSQTFVWSTFQINITDSFWINKIISLPIYITLVPLVELAGIPFFLLFTLKRMTLTDKIYFYGSSAFFLSTYIIAYSGANNYCMRGMLLPCFIFYYLFAKYHHQTIKNLIFNSKRLSFIFATIIILSSTGTILEANGKISNAWRSSSIKYGTRNNVLPTTYRALARNSSVTIYNPGQIDRNNSRLKYNAEKLISPVDIKNMDEWEREILRSPRKGWLF